MLWMFAAFKHPDVQRLVDDAKTSQERQMSHSLGSTRNRANPEDRPATVLDSTLEIASVEEVQSWMVHPTAVPESSPLVLLKSGIAKPPVFIVTGLSGAATDVLQLGRSMQCNRPIYAVQARGFDGAESPLESVEAMAQYFLGAIREQQPEGPYILAGYSFGGLVALEMAQMLAQAGDQPALLALLESYVHPQYWPFLVRLSTITEIAKQRALTLARSSPQASIEYFAERARGIAERMRVKKEKSVGPVFRWFSPSLPEGTPQGALQVFAACVIAFRQYRPRPYAGKVVFFQPRNYGTYPKDPYRMWRNLTRAFEVQIVSGNHLSMVREEAKDLGVRLSVCIDEVLGGVRCP